MATKPTWMNEHKSPFSRSFSQTFMSSPTLSSTDPINVHFFNLAFFPSAGGTYHTPILSCVFEARENRALVLDDEIEAEDGDGR